MVGSRAILTRYMSYLKYLACCNIIKDFRLFVLVDKDDMNRKMALHKGQALSKIKDIEGYDENKHLTFL